MQFIEEFTPQTWLPSLIPVVRVCEFSAHCPGAIPAASSWALFNLGTNLPILVFTLDTGRHFEETYKVMNQTLSKYGKKIRVCFPDKDQVEKMMTQNGPFSFYESVENRKECCHIRKVEPLRKVLNQASCWVTGLRAGQSDNRQALTRFEFDAVNQVVKFNPLADWSFEKVNDYLKLNHVPYNILHDRGFLSIGCAPCTRAVAPGEGIRSGRWWWENNTSRECGLHENDQNIG